MTGGDLVLCIGNATRGDDGAGARVAALLEERVPPGARLIAARQLDVTLAVDVAESRRVVFVDAERRDGDAEAYPITAEGAATTHTLSPGALLALAEALYDACPAAFLVSVPASDMAHGETLSERTEAACEHAASLVLGLLAAES